MKPAAERYGTLVSCLRLSYLLYNCVPVRSTPSRCLLVFVFGQWQSDSDQLGKIRGRIRGIGTLINEAACFELGEWKACCDDGVTLEHQLVALAVQEDAPVPGNALGRGMLVADAGRAIGGDGVIPARVVSNLVERAQVFVEALAGQCGCHGSAVKIDLFAVAVV